MNTHINELGDIVCEHGTAMDVHCCNCHSGFLFDINSCVCEICKHKRIQIGPCEPRENGCEHPHTCLICGGKIGNTSWNFKVLGAKSTHDKKRKIQIINRL